MMTEGETLQRAYEEGAHGYWWKGEWIVIQIPTYPEFNENEVKPLPSGHRWFKNYRKA